MQRAIMNTRAYLQLECGAVFFQIQHFSIQLFNVLWTTENRWGRRNTIQNEQHKRSQMISLPAKRR